MITKKQFDQFFNIWREHVFHILYRQQGIFIYKVQIFIDVNRGVKLGSFSPEILAKCNLKQQRFLSF